MEGQITAEVSIQNNDSNENPYNFTIMGTGQSGFGLKQEEEGGLDIIFPDGDDLLVAGQTRTITWRGAGRQSSSRSSIPGITGRPIVDR